MSQYSEGHPLWRPSDRELENVEFFLLDVDGEPCGRGVTQRGALRAMIAAGAPARPLNPEDLDEPADHTA